MSNGQVALENRLDLQKVSVDNRDPNFSNKKAKQKHYKDGSMQQSTHFLFFRDKCS